MKYSLLNAIVYDILWRLCEAYPSLRPNSLVKMAKDHCFPDWVEWKTEMTMKSVDSQVEDLKAQWNTQENQKIVHKVQEAYPNSRVTLHDEQTGAVRIEKPSDGSEAQNRLGGEIRIKSPWSE